MGVTEKLRGGGAFLTATPDSERLVYRVGVGVSGSSDDGSREFNLEYGFEGRPNLQSHGGSLTLRVRS